MDVRLKEEDRIKEEKLKDMPYVHTSTMPIYCILRVGRRYKTMPAVKGFEKHMTRELYTPNADPEKLKDNEQIYGAADLYEDTKKYLRDCKIYKNSVIGRELLLTATPEFFKGITEKDFFIWKETNLEWLKNTFRENLRAVYLHEDESTKHLHCIVIPKLWSHKAQSYTLQAYKYFNGAKALSDMQDNYAEHMQKTFPVLSRGIKGSRAKHISMKRLYGINNITEKDDIEALKAKAVNQEYLKEKVNYMEKTIKSFEHFTKEKDEINEKLQQENEKLLKEITELKNNIYEETLKNDRNKSAKRGFTGKRYSKSV